jgi:hypothetical protein
VFELVIHGRWRYTPASTHHSITRRTGKEYVRKQGMYESVYNKSCACVTSAYVMKRSLAALAPS